MSTQSLDALAVANTVRIDRARLKARIRRGDTTVMAVLADPPPEALTMTVFTLVCAQHRWGRKRTLEVLASVPLSELKLVGALTVRQRRVLAYQLGVRAAA